MNDLDELERRVRAFTDARDWDRFHSPKNLSMALIAEAAELVEHFQWLTEAESAELSADQRENVALELADILVYLVRIADKLGIDLLEAARRKIAINEARYPVAAVRGSAKKRFEHE